MVATPLEAAYSRRAGEDLRLFGRRLFDTPAPLGDRRLEGQSGDGVPRGAIADDFALGVGDRLRIVLRGGVDRTETAVIGADGLLVVEGLFPVQAAGRSLGVVRRAIEREAAERLQGSQAFVSVDRVREIDVLVLGEVARPGRHRLSAFAGVLDALMAAGGVRRTGSLRRIQAVGSDGITPVDLHGLLTTGRADGDRRLRAGDRIVVPLLGPTIAVAGDVARPGIFELAVEEPDLPLGDVLALAGGPVVQGPARILLQRFDARGRDRPMDVGLPGDGVQHRVRPGDLVRVTVGQGAPVDTVALVGHVAAPGDRAFRRGMTLSDLLGGRDQLGPDAYLAFAALVTTDPGSGSTVIEAVDLGAVVAGRDDWALADGDRLIVLSTEDVRYLGSTDVLTRLAAAGLSTERQADAGTGAIGSTTACPALAALDRALSGAADLAFAGMVEAAARLPGEPLACPPVLVEEPTLLPAMLRHAVLIERGGDRPGLHPVAGDAAKADLERAQGLARRADPGPETGVSAGRIVSRDAPAITVLGPIAPAGRRPLASAPSLSSLLGPDGEVGPDFYPLLGVISRFAPDRLGRVLVPFSPLAVRAGEVDPTLVDRDRVHFLSRERVARGGAEDRSADRPGPVPAEQDRAVDGGAASDPETALIDRLLADRVITVSGAVALPGAYPVPGPTALDTLLEAAGGLTRDADGTSVEILSDTAVGGAGAGDRVATARRVDTRGAEARVQVAPGDTVTVPRRLNPIESGGVAVLGEVRRPGTYPLVRGERLSDLIERAGGLTELAYADGAVFTRVSARDGRRTAFLRRADELERGLERGLAGDDPPDAATVGQVRALIDELRTTRPVGRLSVVADPVVLAREPDRDVVLEPGDRVLFPRRPLTIRVSGEVFSPAAIAFDPDLDAEDYIERAGGFTRSADRSRTFLIHPDGTAAAARVSAWDFRPRHPTPGSTIVVPRDPQPFDFLATTATIGGILGQIALTAAAIAAIED